jgi:hypothetical protein
MTDERFNELAERGVGEALATDSCWLCAERGCWLTRAAGGATWLTRR